ncbi:hypothetical protein [Halalkalirubrum salinum]|uniref:hypothetical protein n=1 Tax=Halalkalirubrum salinum TaxID=2563889 RepID=UPI0010FB352F|nr:hypothetical protein [Halalkalirubrum salinum]
MASPGPPPNAADIKEHVDQALHGLELDPHETSEILNFANEEVPHLQTPETSYFILGSFRSPYERRLRIVENELNKRVSTYAFVLGDLRDIEIPRLPTFRIRFYIIAPYADTIAAVHEQDAGGEVTELGKISETPFFEHSYVLPRDYAWMTDRNLETKEDVFAAAVRIALNPDTEEETIEQELEALVENANSNGIEISIDELNDRIEEREEEGPDLTSYSWVHLNEFRLFELHDRCIPWADPDDLRTAVEKIP